MEHLRSVVIEYDELGNVVGCHDIKALTTEQIANHKKVAKENLAKKLAEKNLKIEELEKQVNGLVAKLKRAELIACKCLFDNEVEKGNVETTEEFEKMFSGFLYGKEFDFEVCPPFFKNLVEKE